MSKCPLCAGEAGGMVIDCPLCVGTGAVTVELESAFMLSVDALSKNLINTQDPWELERAIRKLRAEVMGHEE